MGLLIRDMKKEDYRSVLELYRQAYALHLENRSDVFARTEPPLTEEAYSGLLADQSAVALIAEADGVAVGICAAKIREPSGNPVLLPRKIALIEDLCVREDCRRRGVGGALYEEAAARAKARGAHSLELHVWAFNGDAVGFYERMGMRVRSHVMERRL